MLELIIFPLVTLGVTLFAVPYARRFALAFGFVDKPGGRKMHEEAVPPVGGLIIFSIFIVMSLLSGQDVTLNWAFYLSLVLLLVTGYVDDRYYVPASLKFLIHFTAAILIVVPGGAELRSLGNIFSTGNFGLGWAAPVFSVACVVYLINAMNMMDGLDGLAAGKSFIVLLWLMGASFFSGAMPEFLPMAVLAAALLGFLYYNMRHPFRKKACIFLGDAGSMALGLTLAWFCIKLAQGDNRVIEPISVAWILALPIVDAFGLFAMRISEKRHPFSADRRHFHHHFINAGYSDAQATTMILGIGAFFGAVGMFSLAAGVPEYIMTSLWISLWVGHTAMTMKPDGFIRFLKKIHTR